MKLKITIDSKNYEVDVEVAEPEPAGAPPRFHQTVESSAARTSVAVAAAPPIDSTPVVEDKVCRSPVSGLVASVIAQPGQTLQVGDGLLVLEAMKMETQVTASAAGKVAAIKVKTGDSVQAGQVLVEFE
jgi:methylmalonyl-CoA carboxyltransferase small subunit